MAGSSYHTAAARSALPFPLRSSRSRREEEQPNCEHRLVKPVQGEHARGARPFRHRLSR
jgi:hypothetical protein